MSEYGETPEYLKREREHRKQQAHGGWGSSYFNRPAEQTESDEPHEERHRKLSEEIMEEYENAHSFIDKILLRQRSAEKKRISGIINTIVFGGGVIIFAILYIISQLHH